MISSIRDSTRASIRRICAALGLPRSSYCHAAWPTTTQIGDREIGDRIESLFCRHRRRYGYRRIHSDLQDLDISRAPSRVRRLMRERGLRAISPRNFVPRTSDGRADRPADNLEVTRQPELLETIEPSLQVIELLTEKIKEFDEKIAQLCEEKYPETDLLRQIGGVGPITALTYRLVIGDPERFAKSRDAGAYFGLVPKRYQSGDLDKELRISKAGNRYMRTLLVGAAQYILGPFGLDCDLRRRGLALADRGGRGAKKKTVVATARKLSVVMHRLWSSGNQYLPTREIAEVA